MTTKKGLKAEDLAELLPCGDCTVYRWIASDLIPYVNRRIPSAFAKKLKRIWDKTCTPSEASRALEVSPTKIDDMLNNGLLKKILVLRKERIFKNSVLKAKRKGFVVKKSDIAHPRRRGFARLKKSRLKEISKLGNTSLKRKVKNVESERLP